MALTTGERCGFAVTLLMCGCVGAVAYLEGQVPFPSPPNPPSVPVISTASVAILVNGTPIAAEPAINITDANGIIWSARDNPAQQRVDITGALNPAYTPAFQQLYANPQYCRSMNGTSTYTCKMQYAPLLAYQRGQAFLLDVDAACATTCTLNVDALGPRIITKKDGVSAPDGSLAIGQAQLVWFDGTVMRLVYF